MTVIGVRRDNAALSSGGKAHPATAGRSTAGRMMGGITRLLMEAVTQPQPRRAGKRKIGSF
jgi:hypothetical protein